MVLTTTLNRLRAANACTERYQPLLKALGGTSFDHEAPINLLTILEHKGRIEGLKHGELWELWDACVGSLGDEAGGDFEGEVFLPLDESFAGGKDQ